MPGSTSCQQPKLLDEVRRVLRLHHYSIHTERAKESFLHTKRDALICCLCAERLRDVLMHHEEARQEERS